MSGVNGCCAEPLPPEWAVLGLPSRRPKRGFALGRSLSTGGEFGTIWTVRRPLVYRVPDTLHAEGLVEFQDAEPGDGEPTRRKAARTERGRRLFSEGLKEPVALMRDRRGVRSPHRYLHLDNRTHAGTS